jgi:hypothetical protein
LHAADDIRAALKFVAELAEQEPLVPLRRFSRLLVPLRYGLQRRQVLNLK